MGALKLQEQRTNPRYDVDLAVGVAFGGVDVPGRIVNLSLGGCLLRASLDPAVHVGQRLKVSFIVPAPGGSISVAATAELRWVNDLDRESMGVQFVTGFRAREIYALGEYFKQLR